jgi:hypothetical protein
MSFSIVGVDLFYRPRRAFLSSESMFFIVGINVFYRLANWVFLAAKAMSLF